MMTCAERLPRLLMVGIFTLTMNSMTASISRAANFTYASGIQNGNWGNTALWLGGNAAPTNGFNTDIFIEGSDQSPDIQDNFNNNVDYFIDSITLSSGYTGGGDVNLGGGTLTIFNRIDNDESGRALIFSNQVEVGTSATFTIVADLGDIEFNQDLDLTLDTPLISVSGGERVFFHSGFGDPGNVVNSATLSIGGGTFVQLGGSSSEITQVNITSGELELNGGGHLGTNTNVDIFSGSTFDLNNNSENIDVLTGSGSVDLGTGTLTFGESASVDASFTFSGVISGTGGIFKNQSGEAVLSGSNTYSGTTTIDNGTLRLSGSGRISNSSDVIVNVNGTFDLGGVSDTVDSIEGDGTILLGGGILTIDETSGARSFNGNILESGELQMSGGGSLSLGGNNTFTLLDINSGLVAVSSAANLGSGTVELGSGTLQTTGTFTSNRPMVINSSSATINVNSATTFTQSGVISGSGELNKVGNGTLVLSASNTYTGNTDINDGVVQLSGSGRISNSSDVELIAGATLDLNNISDTVASLSGTGGTVDTGGSSGRITLNASSGTFTYSGAIIGSGGLTKNGNHNFIINSAMTYSGATVINDGFLQFTGSGDFSSASDISVAAGATWDLNGLSDLVDSISGDGSITLGGATLTVDESTATRTFSGIISESGNFVKSGSGTLVFSGNNTYTGTTTFDQGILRVSSSSNLGGGQLIFDSGSLNTTASFTNSRQVTINAGDSANFDVNEGTTLTQTGIVVNGSTSTLQKLGGGIFELTSASGNNFVGDILVSAGTLQFGSGDTVGNATDVTVSSGATFTLTQTEGIDQLSGAGQVNIFNFSLFEVGLDNGSSTFSGVIAGTLGRFSKAGTGTQTLSGNNTYTGATSISGGTLQLAGAGRLSDLTDVTVGAGATFDLNGVTDAIDVLSGSGSVILGGATFTVGANSGSGTFSGDISESGGLIKVGAGTQTLSGNNTWDSGVQINGGTLSISSSSNYGGGGISIDGATLEVTGSFTNFSTLTLQAGGGTIDVDAGQTFTHGAGTPFAGPGDLTKSDSGTFQVAGFANYGGDTFINGGTLRLTTFGDLPDTTNVFVASGAIWDLNTESDTVTSASGSGDVDLGSGTLTVTQNGGSRELGGTLFGNGGIVKDGTHVFTLSGNNTYAGPTTINDGILEIFGNNNLGAAICDLFSNGVTLRIFENPVDLGVGRSITLQSGGGTVELGDAGGEAVTIPGVISGTGSLTFIAQNEENATLSGVNSYQGGTRVDTANLFINQNANLGNNSGALTLAQGILTTTASFTNQHAIILDGGGSIDVNAGTLTQAAGISGIGNLFIGGPGIMMLTQPATHAGNTNIGSDGTLQFGSGELPDAFDVTVNGLWDLNGVSDTIDGLFGTGTVLLGGGTLTVGAANGGGNFSGSIQESGAFVKTGSGTQVLSGTNSYTTSTTIDEGVLQITNNSSLGDVSAALIFNDGTLRTTTTFSTGRNTFINTVGQFDTADGTTLTFTSPIDGGVNADLFKVGLGTLELTQPSTFGGSTEVQEGTLRLSGGGLLPSAIVDVFTGATLDATDVVDTIGTLLGGGDVLLGNGTLTIGADDNSGTFSGIITGTGTGGTIIKEGAGTAIFTGANTYAGGTEINDGTLQISQDANLGELGGQVSFDGGKLRVTADIPNMVREMTIGAGGGTIEVDALTTLGAGGNIAGIGEVTKTGDGTLILSGISSYDGTNVLAGVLSVGFNFNLGTASGQLTIDGATLHTTNNFTTTRLTTIGSGGATFDVDEVLPGADHTHNGIIQGNAGANPFVKTGLGEMRLGGVNTFSAPIHINQGRLSVNSSSPLGSTSNTIVFGGGTWFVDGTFANSRTVQLNQNGGTIDVAGGFTLTQSGVIEDGSNGPAGSLSKAGAGTLRLNAMNTYSSGTNIQNGFLRLLAGGRLPDTTDVNVASGATFDLNNVSDAIDGLAGSGDVLLGAGALTVGADDGGGTFSGTISESGSLVKVGTGTQSLRTKTVGQDTFPNTYTGGTEINGGTLDVEGNENLGEASGGLSFDGGTLQVSGDASVGTNRLVTLNAGGGTLSTVGGDSSMTFNNVISGSGNLTKIGQGTVTIAANNTYTGDTNVNAGRFVLNGAGRIPDASFVTVNAAGIMNEGLDLNNISDTIGGLEGNGDIFLGTATLTVNGGGDFTGTIEGTGGLTKTGPGNLILGGVSTYAGGSNINGGSVEIDADNRLGDTTGPLGFDGGTLFTAGTFSTARATTMNVGGGTFDVPISNTFTHNGNISGVGGLGKQGAGTLLLTAVSSYGGPTAITNGTLRLGGSERLPNTTSLAVNAPADFDLNNFNETIDGLSGDGTVNLTNAQLTVGISGGGGNFSGVITGTGDFQKEGAGTQTLAGGAHSFSGATVVNGGELILNAGGSISQTTLSVGFNNGSDGTTTADGASTTWDVSGNLTVGAQGVGRLNIDNGAMMTVGGQVLIGAGLGSGTLLVDGGTLDNSAGTGILVQEGTLGGAGNILADIINQDILAPGTSAGVLNVAGTYVQEITGTFSAEIGGTGVGQFDLLNVTSTASLSGDLQLGLLGFTPAPSDTFAILVAGSLVGEFGNVADGARLNISSGGTGSFQVDYTPTSVVLSDFVGTAIATGDFDNDGDVDGRDFLVWQRGGSPNPLSSGDLALWQSEYGTPFSAANAAVPEPATMASVLFFLLTLGSRYPNAIRRVRDHG